MIAPERPRFWSRLLDVLLRYGAWLAFSAVSLQVVLQFRTNVLDLLIMFRVSHWFIPAIDKTATILLILLWLVGVMGLMSYLSSVQAWRESRCWINRAAAAEARALFCSYGRHDVYRVNAAGGDDHD